MTEVIKTVIFDIGNVLVDFCWREVYESFGLQEDEVEKLADATVRHQAWLDLDKGILKPEDAEAEYRKAAPEYDEYISRIYPNIHSMLVQFPYAVSWIKELKERGYQIYILSNWSKVAYDACLKKGLSFLPLVDGAVFSFQEFVIKPDKQIYDILCKRYHINPQEAVFLDDSIKNVESAREYGLHAIHFTSYAQGRDELETLLEQG